MNDPHVNWLSYRLRTVEGVSYKDDALPVLFETNEFRAELDKGVLTVYLKNHFSTSGEAMQMVSPYLKSWEILSEIKNGLGCLKFEYETSEIVDRNPSPPGSKQVTLATGTATLSLTCSAKIHVTRANYPVPPQQFVADSMVESLWKRYARHQKGGEPLTGMAYYCLSVIQADAGGRIMAANKYNVHQDVIAKLGELTSEIGDDGEARKRDKDSVIRPLTEKEKTWIAEAVKLFILRVGEFAAASSTGRPQITLADLPSL